MQGLLEKAKKKRKNPIRKCRKKKVRYWKHRKKR